MRYEEMFLRALGMTVAVETAVLWGMTRFLRIGFIKVGAHQNASHPDEPPPATWRVVALGMLCSSATLPYLWFILPAWVQNRTALMAIGEPAVTLAEAVILMLALPARPARALALSFVCNSVSFVMGLVVFRI